MLYCGNFTRKKRLKICGVKLFFTCAWLPILALIFAKSSLLFTITNHNSIVLNNLCYLLTSNQYFALICPLFGRNETLEVMRSCIRSCLGISCFGIKDWFTFLTISLNDLYSVFQLTNEMWLHPATQLKSIALLQSTTSQRNWALIGMKTDWHQK